MFNYKKLVNDTYIFALGNLGSKLINIVLVPFYTYYLTTADYGIADLVTTTTILLLPIITLSVYDAVLRYAMDKNEEPISVFTNGLFVTIVCSIIFTIMVGLVSFFLADKKIVTYMSLIVILNALKQLLAQFSRSIGKIKLYAGNGIINTFVVAISNIILLKYVNLGLDGYFLSIIIGSVFSIVYLWFGASISQYIKMSTLDRKLVRKSLTYSIPLIPNATSLWANSALGRYVIIFFIGASANGIFAVATKITNILSILYAMFLQAWQLSAISEYQSENRDKIFSNVFESFVMLMIIASSAILGIEKTALRYFVNDVYFEAWKVIPFILLGTIFSSFAEFVGISYLAAQQTKGLMKTTFYSAILSLILNLILVPIMGINGTGVAMIISYLALLIVRLKDTADFVKINVYYKRASVSFVFLLIQTIVIFIVSEDALLLPIQLFLFICVFFLNRKVVKSLFGLFVSGRKK